jgi:NADPH:quinone reductase-like Zn-dependent oxidoreductase
MTLDAPLSARQVLAPRYGAPDVLEVADVEIPQPGPGQVTIDVRAAGVNPADYKGFAAGPNRDETKLPIRPGYEVAGVIAAIGADTEIATGGGAIGDPVLAFRVSGGYASAITVPATNVFAKPDALDFPSAANLLLVGATAADMLRVVPVERGQTILVHGASGAVGVSLLQQAAELGVSVIGTASERSFETVQRFGGTPVAYGDGLEQRVRDLAPDGVDGAFDCIGTDEAADVSLALVSTDRIVTIAGFARAKQDGFQAVGGSDPESSRFRNEVRARLVELAAQGRLVVPVARTYPLAEAGEALAFLAEGHPGGKLALLP